MFKYNIYIYIYIYHVCDIYISDIYIYIIHTCTHTDIYIYICIYYLYIYYTYIYIIHHIYETSDLKEKINNWVLQFLENETKTFLDLQNIFYLLR